jgi:hypothetical protein
VTASTKLKVEKYRKGRSRGAIYTTPSGAQTFLSFTKLAYIFCAGEKSISDALRKGTACWSLDEETLLNMRVKGVKFTGILCRENNDIWLTTTENFFNRELLVSANRSPNRRYLPLRHFSHRPGSTRL